MKVKPAVFLFSLLLLSGTLAKAEIIHSGERAKVEAQTVSGKENSGTKKNDAVQTDTARALTEAQKQAIKTIRDEAEKSAAPIALRLAGIVKQIYDNMLAEKPNDELAQKLSAEMKEAVWNLLSIKGQSFRESVKVLTPEQKQLVKSEMAKPGAPGDILELIARIFSLPEK